MVERLLAAGRDVLVTDGYDAFTTNRVATRAGVSPGSLYQYFPDKGAIVEAVADRWLDELAERVAASLTDHLGAPGPVLVRGTLEALLDALEDDPELLRVVATELPLSRYRDRRQALRRRVADIATAGLAGPSGARRPDPATAAWVLVVAVEALSMQWVLEPPAPRRGESVEEQRSRIIDELTDLCLGYLLGQPSAAAPTGSRVAPRSEDRENV